MLPRATENNKQEEDLDAGSLYFMLQRAFLSDVSAHGITA